jgi:transposase-like protein
MSREEGYKMETEITIPQSLMEAIKQFSDPQVCHDFMVNFRWPGGVTCPYCGCVKLSFISTRKVWHCKDCKKRFSVKVGTIMEDSPLPLEKWFAGIFLITNAKNGISSCEISRALDVTQKTAWFLLHRVRYIMDSGSMNKMTGSVEADETYIGGKAKNMHVDKRREKINGRGGSGKTIVMGILERAAEMNVSNIRTKVVPDTTSNTLHAEIKANVETGAELNTDAHKGYRGLSEEYKHGWVDHAVKYVEGKIHCNGVENYWSLFKRMLHGTYTHVDPRHLQAYLDEQDSRYNLRTLNDGGRFAVAVMAVAGKRLTYSELAERGLKMMAP